MYKIWDNFKIVILIGLSDEIIGNCDNRIDMGITDVLTADYFCSLIGITNVESTSINKSNSLQQRNLLNIDEIMRLPSIRLILNIRGNKPLLLDKVIYTEHPLAKKLKDSPVSEYNPKWVKNVPQKVQVKEKITENTEKKKEKVEWTTF